MITNPSAEPTCPRLLVSFRSLAEVVAGPLSAVDIVDLKEPRNGPLGAVTTQVMHEVRSFLRTDCKLSVALGELVSLNSTQWNRELNVVDYVKIGLSGMRRNRRWTSLLQSAFECLPDATVPVAVAYADDELADSPTPEAVLEFAIGQRVKVLLVDTFSKNDRSLFHYLDFLRLRTLRERCAQAGIEFALAGSINLNCLNQAITIQPEIIGVRGAVTAGGREAVVDPVKISQFREEIEVRHFAFMSSLTKTILQKTTSERK